MAHRGKAYPIAQFGRLYAGDATWPYYPAEKYDIGASFFLPGSGWITWAPVRCEITDYVWGSPVVVYKGYYGTWSGHNIHLGWVLDLATYDGLLTVYGAFWVDGSMMTDDVGSPYSPDPMTFLAHYVDEYNSPWPPLVGGGWGVLGATAVFWP